MKHLKTFEEKVLSVTKPEIDQYDARLRDVLFSLKQNIPVRYHNNIKEYPTEFVLRDATYRVKNTSIYNTPKKNTMSNYTSDFPHGADRPFVNHTYGGVCIRLGKTDKIEFVLIDGGKSIDIYKPSGYILDGSAINQVVTMFKRGAEYIGIDSSTDVYKIERILNREVKDKDVHMNLVVPLV